MAHRRAARGALSLLLTKGWQPAYRSVWLIQGAEIRRDSLVSNTNNGSSNSATYHRLHRRQV